MCADVLRRLGGGCGRNAVEAACTEAVLRLEAEGTGMCGGGEERAAKMWLMSVTLDVSNFSGWSNDTAPCMVKRKRASRRSDD